MDPITRIDMDNGSFPIAKDVLRVLAKTNLSSSHMGVIFVVLDKTFGWHNPDSIKELAIKQRKTEEYIKSSCFEEYTGLPASKVSTLTRELFEWRVIKRTDVRPHKYALNINVSEWDRTIFRKPFRDHGWGKLYRTGNFTKQGSKLYQPVNSTLLDSKVKQHVSALESDGYEALNNLLEITNKNNPLYTPKNSKKKQTAVGKTMPKNIYPSLFEEFWGNYPRKVEKRVALRAWAKLGEHEKGDVISATKNYRDECQYKNREKDFIKYPATFLRQERWKDYMDSAETQEKEAFEAKQRSAHERIALQRFISGRVSSQPGPSLNSRRETGKSFCVLFRGKQPG